MKTDERILRLVRDYAPVTARGVAGQLEVSRSTVDRALGRLVDAGDVTVLSPRPGYVPVPGERTRRYGVTVAGERRCERA